MATAQAGDRRAWMSDIVERYEGPLVRYAARITGDVDRARDVVQETFLRLCASADGTAENHTAEWLYTVCRNRAIDTIRRGRHTLPINDAKALEIAAPSPPPSGAAGEGEERARIAKELEQLPPSQQEVLRLKFQDGMRYREIARITGNSVANVGFLIHTGIKQLRARMTGGCHELPTNG